MTVMDLLPFLAVIIAGLLTVVVKHILADRRSERKHERRMAAYGRASDRAAYRVRCLKRDRRIARRT